MAIPVVALFAAVTQAQAQTQGEPGWTLPPATLSAAGPLGWPPVVVTDSAGDATALFATATSYSAGGETLLSMERPFRGAWEPALSVPSGGNASGVALAASTDGGATAVWVDRSAGGPYQVWSSSRAQGAAWSVPVRFPLTGAVTDTLGDPGLAQDARGNAVAVWTESNQRNTATWLLAARRSAGVWSAPRRLSDAGAQVYDEYPARVTVDAAGDFVVAWSQFLAPSTVSVDAEELIGGVWEGEQTVESGGDYLTSVALGENTAGEAAAAWADIQRGSVQAATLRNGAWTLNGPPTAHLYAACETSPPRAAVDGAGDALLAWVGESGQVEARDLAAAGAWASTAQSVSTLPAGDHASDPQISVDPAGDALVSWTAYDTTTGTWSTQDAWRPAAGSWRAPVTLSGPDAYDATPSLSMDPQGNAIEAWGDTVAHENYEVRATAFAPAPLAAGLQPPLRPMVTSKPQAYVGTAVGAATAPSVPGGTVGAPLAPVYLSAYRQQLWIARGSRIASATIHNTNAYPVTGTATMLEAPPAKLAGVSGAASAAPRALAGLVRFNLPAHTSGVIAFRLGRAALARLRAQAPARGHDLVQVRLMIGGSSGQTASALGIYALDGPSLTRAVSLPAPGNQPGSSVAVDPWARDAC